MALIAYGRFREAVRSFDRALAERPDDTKALLVKATALDRIGLFAPALPLIERALEDFDIALGINPDDITALHNKAAALKQLGRDREASQIMDKVMERTDGHGPYSVI
jgi:Flp pilus assembly protein TadD